MRTQFWYKTCSTPNHLSRFFFFFPYEMQLFIYLKYSQLLIFRTSKNVNPLVRKRIESVYTIIFSITNSPERSLGELLSVTLPSTLLETGVNPEGVSSQFSIFIFWYTQTSALQPLRWRIKLNKLIFFFKSKTLFRSNSNNNLIFSSEKNKRKKTRGKKIYLQLRSVNLHHPSVILICTCPWLEIRNSVRQPTFGLCRYSHSTTVKWVSLPRRDTGWVPG